MTDEPTERDFTYEGNAEIALFRAQEILEDTNLTIEDRCALAAEWREMSDSWSARAADAFVTVDQDPDEAEAQREALKVVDG